MRMSDQAGRPCPGRAGGIWPRSGDAVEVIVVSAMAAHETADHDRSRHRHDVRNAQLPVCVVVEFGEIAGFGGFAIAQLSEQLPTNHMTRLS